MNKIYECECGYKATSPSQIGGHKSHCKIHLQHKGTLYIREQIYQEHGQKIAKFYQCKQQEELQKWLDAKHTCEKCGKVMTEKFGSGRFCSKSCAAKRSISPETYRDIGVKVRNTLSQYNYKQIFEDKYYNNPNFCVICNKVLPYNKRRYKTCSKECYIKLQSLNTSKAIVKHQGNLNSKGFVAYKGGTYKGIHCDSSWELAFLVYCLDHNIPIRRCDRYFMYTYKNKEHKYFPDFIVNETTIIEIKNFVTPLVTTKCLSVPSNIDFKLLLKSDIQPMYKYCVDRYGTDFCTVLYE